MAGKRRQLPSAVIGVVVGLMTLAVWAPFALRHGQVDPATADATAPATATSRGVEVTRPTRAAFLGDSFTAGAGAGDPEADRWTAVVAAELDWTEQNHGFGGTGYTTAGPLTGGDTYADRIPEVADGRPDVVIVAGGRNDMGADEVTQRDSVRDTFQSLREALPDARILAVQPMWDARPYPDELDQLGAIIADECGAADCTYLPIDNPLEGRPELIDVSGVHPDTDGHRALGTAVLEALRPLRVAGEVPD